MSIIGSPLRYPGGKANLCKYIERVIIVNGMQQCKFVEPFAGGAAVTLYLLQKGLISSAVLLERDPLVYAFWKAVFAHTEELCDLIRTTDITIETWNLLEANRSIDLPAQPIIPELGFTALFFNRTNFSGILKAGPIGGQSQAGKYKIDCRFKKQRLINDISLLSTYRDKVTVLWGDALTFLENEATNLARNGSFVYIDPPYYHKGESLYRHFFNNEQHIQLANRLKAARYPWLLSYDDCGFINQLYGRDKDLHTRQLYFDYSVRAAKKKSELLISNVEIPPIEKQGTLIS